MFRGVLGGGLDGRAGGRIVGGSRVPVAQGGTCGYLPPQLPGGPLRAPQRESAFFCSVPQTVPAPRTHLASPRGTRVQPDRKDLAESSEQTKNPSAAVASSVEAIVCPLLQARGLELFDLSFRLEQGGWVLRITIDVVQGEPEQTVTIDQCAEVSRDLSTALDAADPLPHAYSLEVSSPGVERPLRGSDDYRRFQGRRVKVTLHEPLEGAGAVVRGVLVGIEGDVVLVDEGQPEALSIPLSGIKRANLVYEMPGQPKKGSSKKKRRSNTQRRD